MESKTPIKRIFHKVNMEDGEKYISIQLIHYEHTIIFTEKHTHGEILGRLKRKFGISDESLDIGEINNGEIISFMKSRKNLL